MHIARARAGGVDKNDRNREQCPDGWTSRTSQIIHIVRLPIGLPTSQSGIEYVPQSGKEAAQEVAKALLYPFVNNLGQSTTANAPRAFAPLKLTREDKDQASAAVSDELKRIGVPPLQLCTITPSKPQTNYIMQKAFTRVTKSVLEKGYPREQYK